MNRPRRQWNIGRRERAVLWRVGLLAALLGFLWLLFAPGRGYVHLRGQLKRVAQLEMENAELERKNRAMSSEIKRLRSDDAYLEQVAREQHELLKKNETVYEFNARK